MTRRNRLNRLNSLGARRRVLLLVAVGLLSAAAAAQGQLAKLVASDAAGSDWFGYSVAVSGDTAVIGSYHDDHTGGDNAGSADVYQHSAGGWSEQAKLIASDAAASDEFGTSVAISGDTAVIGAPADDHAGGTNAGSAYVFVRSGGVWSQQAKLIASDAAAGDFFGASVAVDGDTAVVGAYAADHSGSYEVGAAFVFVRSGGVWTQQAKLTAADAFPGDLFGRSVAISGDKAVIGADQAGLWNAGAAYVFLRSGANWSQWPALIASDSGADDAFGYSVAISGDTVVVGAGYDDNTGGTDAGSVYVFALSGGTWVQEAKLTASDGAANDRFGYCVAVAADTLVVGAPWDTHGGGTYAGSAYVFLRSDGVWTSRAKLAGDDVAPFDTFARAVAISGSTAVIGVPNADLPGATDAGAAYVTNLARYLDFSKLIASDPGPDDQFGTSVSVSGDTAVIGAPFDYHAGGSAGSAYVFVRSGGDWLQQAMLTASDAAAAFGTSVAISGDTAVIGASRTAMYTGAAYVFVRTGGIWTQQAKLTAADGQPNEYFGCAVAVDGDTALIGAFQDDQIGSAYIFVRSSGVWSEQVKLGDSNPSYGDSFGLAVGLSGNIAVIGAPADDLVAANAGSVTPFVYYSYGEWVRQPKLVTADVAAGDSFGRGLSVSGDTVVVGAPSHDAGGTDAGAAYIFVCSDGSWSKQAKLIAPDAAAGDFFGTSVAISGERALIGAPGNDYLGGTDCGSAYFFVRSGGVWTAQGEFGAFDAAASDYFGHSVAAFGRTAVIGVPGDTHAGGNRAGSAYVWGLNFPAPGDLDADGDIDFDDFVIFADSLAGPGSPYPPGCGLADLDSDADVDLVDFTEFQVLFPG